MGKFKFIFSQGFVVIAFSTNLVFQILSAVLFPSTFLEWVCWGFFGVCVGHGGVGFLVLFYLGFLDVWFFSLVLLCVATSSNTFGKS